jgi:hypothetical protein
MRRSRSGSVQAWHIVGLVLMLALLEGCEGSKPLPLGQERVAADERDIARRMIELIEQVSLDRAGSGGKVMRFNQVKTLGCVDASLEVPVLEPDLAQGIFATPGTFRARVRFANASELDDREPDLRGASVSVLDARAPDGSRAVQDFLFNSHPALFAADPRSFLAFIEATADDRLWWYFVNPADSHFKALWTLFRARATPASPFDVTYWSTTPFRHGRSSAVAVKHALLPCSSPSHEASEPPGEDKLRAAMAEHLERQSACFDFAVQFQTDPAVMPIEDASRAWPEDESPLRVVARLQIPPQAFTSDSALAQCEATTFTPWRGIADHRPLGGINRVRALVYPALAEFRTSGATRP